MLVKYRKCDHCGKELDGMKDCTECELDLAYDLFTDVDLCTNCIKDLCQYVKVFLNRKKD